MDLQNILDAIDRLSPETLQEIRTRIAGRERSLYQERLSREDAEAWITELHAAIAEFRDGLLPEQLDEIVAAMNIGYVSPKELALLEKLQD